MLFFSLCTITQWIPGNWESCSFTTHMLVSFLSVLSQTDVLQILFQISLNWLVSIWYEFFVKDISEQSIVQGFFKDIIIFEKQSLDSLKLYYCLALPFKLNSSKWKVLYWVKYLEGSCHISDWVECYVNCYVDYFSYIQL